MREYEQQAEFKEGRHRERARGRERERESEGGREGGRGRERERAIIISNLLSFEVVLTPKTVNFKS